MKLVVGLGNPGETYARTRHNVGFLVADGLARSFGSDFTARKFGAEIAESSAGGERVWIMKPQTFMNASGESVGPALRFWKLSSDDLVVIHDDLELEPFRVQLKVGGGHGGHNGLKSVNAHVGSPDYARIASASGARLRRWIRPRTSCPGFRRERKHRSRRASYGPSTRPARFASSAP